MRDDSFGVEVNFSLVHNNGNYDMGFHYMDSDGKDASSQVSTDSLEEGMSAIMQEIIDQISNPNYVEEEKEFDLDEYIASLEDQVQSLSIDKKILEDRLNNIVTEKSDDRKKNDDDSFLEVVDLLNKFFY